MNQAQNNEVTLLFVDASHFVMGCDFLWYVYGFDVFMEKINTITDSTDKENKQAMDRLISDKVQLFDNLLPVEKIHIFVLPSFYNRLLSCGKCFRL